MNPLPASASAAAAPAQRRWRVLLVHNRYRQRGGEDAVFDAEAELLARHGHAVERYLRHNDDTAGMPRLQLARESWWSRRSAADLEALAARFEPDLVHVHNSFALISPSLHAAAARLGLPVVQTLHNHRLFCAQGASLRDGRECHDCLGRLPWPALRHRCYRGSLAETAVLAAGQIGHRLRGTWQHDVTLYLCLSEHAAALFERAGLPRERLRVKPNFIDLPPVPAAPGPRRGLLFVGRLAAEKGTALLAAAAALRAPGALPIRVIGDGPERTALAGRPGLECLGPLPTEQVWQAMRDARALLLPSLAAESFPRVLVEAFASALPVIASRAGALPELIDDGSTGWLFDATAVDAPQRLAALMAHIEADGDAAARAGAAAQAQHAAHWAGERNHARLVQLYAEAVSLHGGKLAP